MWAEIMAQFENHTKKQEVVEALLRRGYSVSQDGDIEANGVRIADQRLARDIGVGRRTVRNTADEIASDPQLLDVFNNLSSVPFLEDAASILGLTVITVTVEDATETGILAALTAIFDEHDVLIRQAIVQDPYFTNKPQFTAIVEEFNSELVAEINSLEFVEKTSFN